MDTEFPNVVTRRELKEYNSVLIVRAYRRLSDNELNLALSKWMKAKRLKKIPRNTTIEVISICGFDREGL